MKLWFLSSFSRLFPTISVRRMSKRLVADSYANQDKWSSSSSSFCRNQNISKRRRSGCLTQSKRAGHIWVDRIIQTREAVCWWGKRRRRGRNRLRRGEWIGGWRKEGRTVSRWSCFEGELENDMMREEERRGKRHRQRNVSDFWKLDFVIYQV